MLCEVCQQPCVKYGKHRNGSQRWFCRACFLNFTERPANVEEPDRVFADRELTMDMASQALSLIMEDASVRSTCRLLRMSQRTLLHLILRVGQGCERMMPTYIVSVPCLHVQCDELWSFIWCKEKTRVRKHYAEAFGDCYTWTALEPCSKLILAYAVGRRDNRTGMEFIRRLRAAVHGFPQLDTDGLGIYRSIIPLVFGRSQDHAQIVKIFDAPAQGEARYSPPEIIDIHKFAGGGNPDLDTASTSLVERSNLTFRMMLRRFTRLTNAFSKSPEHHRAAIGLFVMVYNFVRPHMTLTEASEGRRKTTPAMVAGISSRPWTMRELIERVVPQGSAAEVG